MRKIFLILCLLLPTFSLANEGDPVLENIVTEGDILVGGSVGVGTPAPNYPIEIIHTTDKSLLYITQSKNSGGSSNIIDIVDDRGYGGVNSGSLIYGYAWWSGTETGSFLDFETFDGGGYTSRFWVGLDGNVGIGTAGPTQKLEVAGTIYSTSGGFKFPDGSTQTSAVSGSTSAKWQVVSPSDSVTTINTALSTGNPVYFSPGTYTPTSDYICPNVGQLITGAGVTRTIISVTHANIAGFTKGVFYFSSGENGPALRDMSIIFEQPQDPATVDNLYQYKPAVYAQACARFKIQDLRIERAWDGIDMKAVGTTNSGGAFINNLEMSMFRVGIDIAGALDTIRISNLHIWPFGNVKALGLRPYMDDSDTIGIKFGRGDQSFITNYFSNCYCAIYLYNEPAIAMPGTGRITVSSGSFERGYALLSTSSSAIALFDSCSFSYSLVGTNSIAANGGNVNITNSRFAHNNAGASEPMITMSGNGNMNISNCHMYNTSHEKWLYATGGDVMLSNNYFIAYSSVYSSYFIDISTSALITMTGNRVRTLNGSGNNKILDVNVVSNNHNITGNTFRGWTVDSPSGGWGTSVYDNNN